MDAQNHFAAQATRLSNTASDHTQIKVIKIYEKLSEKYLNDGDLDDLFDNLNEFVNALE